MHEVLVNRLGGLSLPRKSVVSLTDRPDMTLDVYRGRKTTIIQQLVSHWFIRLHEEIILGLQRVDYLPYRRANHGTVEVQWFEHLWDYENMFETGVARADEC